MAAKTIGYNVIATDGHARESPVRWEHHLPWRLHDHMPARLIGLCQTPCVDTATSVARGKEAKGLDYRRMILSAWPSGNPDVSDEDDAFWKAAEEAEMPIHIHVGFGLAGGRQKDETRE